MKVKAKIIIEENIPEGEDCYTEEKRYCFFGYIESAYCELWCMNREWDEEIGDWKRLALCKDAQYAHVQNKELGTNED